MASLTDAQAISPEPLGVRFDEDSFWVDLADGRTLGIPLAWFSRLLHGTSDQRAKVSLSRELGHVRRLRRSPGARP